MQKISNLDFEAAQRSHHLGVESIWWRRSEAPGMRLEAEPGIEPRYTALQAAA
jgi:hypothetical protein